MTTVDRSIVVAVFEMRSEADAAINELESAGFSLDQIGFVVRDKDTGETVEHKTEAGAGATAGVVSGGILGGVIGAAIALLIPGVGPAIAGGILGATLGGVAIGATVGGVMGVLIGLGVPEEEARYYESEFTSGRTIVTVRVDGRAQEATSILHRNGGYDTNTRPPHVLSPPISPIAQTPQAPAYSPAVNSGVYNTNRQPDQMAQPAFPTSTPSSQRVDPITGVTQTNERVPVNSGGYGLQRDPTVENDATARPYDTNVRPANPVVDDGSRNTLFERPVEPGTVEPGGWNDPNVRFPRVP